MSLRAALRRTKREAARRIPMVPGVVPDRLPETLNRASAEAAEVLPPMSGSVIVLQLFTPEDGLEMVGANFGGEPAINQLRRLLEQTGGDMPTIVLAARQPKGYK